MYQHLGIKTKILRYRLRLAIMIVCSKTKSVVLLASKLYYSNTSHDQRFNGNYLLPTLTEIQGIKLGDEMIVIRQITFHS